MFENQLMQKPDPRDIVIYRSGPGHLLLCRSPGAGHKFRCKSSEVPGGGGGGAVTGQSDNCINEFKFICLGYCRFTLKWCGFQNPEKSCTV